jgi:hypothetical protein
VADGAGNGFGAAGTEAGAGFEADGGDATGR